MSKKRTTTKEEKRLTVGLLMTNFGREFHREAWSGIADAALERGVNLICFDGGILRASEGFVAQGNVLYDLVSSEALDGLIIWASILDWEVEPEEMEAFCKSFHPLPTVSVGQKVEGIPSILVDNYQGMREDVAHLIDIHGYRRLAFIHGPKGSREEEQRYRAYADVLAEHDIPLDSKLVTPYCSWERDDGHAMVRLLLDERKVDFEVIIAANDSLALGALEELQNRGVRVPQEMGVVGFDDVEETRATILFLTTVRQPLDKVGKQAIDQMLAVIEGEQVSEQVVVPLQLMVRRSCGCQSVAVVEVSTGPKKRASSKNPWPDAFIAEREDVLADMVQVPQALSGGTTPDDVGHVLDGFIAETAGKSPGGFLANWDDALHRVAMAGGNARAWHGILSTLRRRALPYLGGRSLSQAEDLWHQARALVEETAVQACTYADFQRGRRDRVLHEIDQLLITSPTVDELLDVIARELPRLGIPSAYLSLYEGEEMLPQECRLILAYDEGDPVHPRGRVELEAGGVRFPSQTLVPEGMLPRTRGYSMVVEPLYFRDHHFGFALFEVAQQELTICETLSTQISSALWRARLQEDRRQVEKTLIEERNLLHTLIDNLPGHIYAKDTESRFLIANQAVARALGASTTDELRGKTDFDFHPLELAQQYYADEQAIFASGESLHDHEEPIFDHETGTQHWLLTSKIIFRDSEGQVAGLMGLNRDITELKQARDVLVKRATQLETAAEVSRAAGSVLDVDALIHQVVNLVQERFDLYYAGLFLVDEAGKWAVLQAATGQAGQKMLELGHKLAIGGESMIGWCVANSRARIALDVGEDAVRFDNPHLPDTRSELALPLISRDKVIGALSIQSAKEAAFGDTDVAVLQTMADQLANAIQVTRLFDQAQAQAMEMSVLSELSRTFASYLAVQEVLDEVYRGASRLLDATNFYIALYDSDKDEVAFPFDTTEEEGDKFLALPVDQGITGYIIRHRKSVLIRENVSEWLAEMGIVMVGEPALSWLGVPMIAGDQVLGVMGVQSYTTPCAYDEHDRDLLTALAAQAATALANARLFEQTQAVLAEVEATQRRYLERAWSEYTQTQRVSGYRQTNVDLVPLGDAVLPEVQQVIREQRTVVLQDDDGASVLVVPIMLRGQLLGALGFKRKGEGDQWSAEDIALVEGIGEQFALAAENIRLLDETQRRAARERLARDITDKMRRAASIDDIVQTAVDELFGALGTSRAFVKLGVAPSLQADGGDRDES